MSKLVAIIPVEDSSTGETLYEKIEDTILYNDEVSMNLMGICTDEGSILVGSVQGVGARLKSSHPYLVHLKDPSHLYKPV